MGSIKYLLLVVQDPVPDSVSPDLLLDHPGSNPDPAPGRLARCHRVPPWPAVLESWKRSFQGKLNLT